jgi:purine-binding chemotaxis protein CheW
MQIVVFELAGAPYALPVEAVREVLPYQQPRPLPAADSWDLGVVSVRGAIVRVWDLGARLGLEPGGAPGGFVVAEADVPVAFVVERVVGVQEISAELEPLPYFRDALGVAAGERLVVVLDAARILGGVTDEAGDGLEELSKRELDRLAREAGIPGRTRMDRPQLIAALRAR